MSAQAPVLDPFSVTSENAPIGDPIAPQPSSTPGDSASTPATTESDTPDSGSGLPWRKPRRSPNRPAARKAARDKAPRPPRPAKDDATLKKALVELYTAGGMMWAPFDPQCGMAVVNSAEPCADALVKLAAENDAVRRALSSLTQTSAWGGVIAAHLPVITAVVSHHVAGFKAPSVPDNVVGMDDAPRTRPATMRAKGAADGFGRFCPNCSAALVKGVVHNCGEGA